MYVYDVSSGLSADMEPETSFVAVDSSTAKELRLRASGDTDYVGALYRGDVNNSHLDGRVAFMDTGLDLACEDSNAQVVIVANQILQTLGPDSPQAAEIQQIVDSCQPSIYVDDFSTGGRGDVSPSV